MTSPSPSASPSTNSAAPLATATPQAVSVRPIVPTQVFVPSIGINAGVEAKASQWSKDPHQGYYAWHYPIPDDMYHVVWWKTGAQLGQPGMAVFMGHHQIGGFGVFNRLGELKPGQTAMVEGDGLVIHLQVIAVQANLPKDYPTAFMNAMAHPPAGARAAFITCSGTVDGSSHKDNTVVYFAITGATLA
ncbi:MAG TPA: class F sortase [Candidatus Saccharimonadales bacterium]|nr:class F sortase [Candidatus Saccharimonadales bacterium]